MPRQEGSRTDPLVIAGTEDPCSACGYGSHDEDGFCLTRGARHIAKNDEAHLDRYVLCQEDICQ